MQAATKTEKGTVQVHAYASPGLGSVNTFWVESATGVVVIDAQRLVSQAKIVLAEIAKTGKPIEAIILTHIHPDHIGGTKAFTDAFPSAAVLGSKATIESMRADEGGLLALARQWLGEDFQFVFPTGVLDEERPLKLAGLTFQVKQVGPGEASSMDVLYLEEAGALFAADVTCGAMTPFLAEQRTKLWLGQVDQISRAFPDARMMYPGHGDPAEPSQLIAQTREYLSWFRNLIAARMAESETLTPQIRGELVSEVERKYPGYLPVAAIPDVIGLNVDGVWAELLRERGREATPNTDTPGWRFYQKHLSFFYNKDVDGLLASDYAEDAQLISYDFAVRGHAAMRPVFLAYLDMMGDFKVKTTDHFREAEDSVMLEATLEGPKIGERKVYDIFLFRNGKAIYHFTGVR